MREPAHNQEAEKALLGCMLFNADSALKYIKQSKLEPTDFYSASHRLIFEHMLKLRSRNVKLDLFTLADSLRGSGLLDHVGGAAYLSYISDFSSSIASEAYIQTVCQIILRTSLKRDLVRHYAKATD